jgi:hypothetical protein
MKKKVVSLEYRVNKAFEGKYFMGHTPTLTLSGTMGAWGGLINPESSGVSLYVNIPLLFQIAPVLPLMPNYG